MIITYFICTDQETGPCPGYKGAVMVLNELDDDERDLQSGPMYKICLRDGVTITDAFMDELYPAPISRFLAWDNISACWDSLPERAGNDGG